MARDPGSIWDPLPEAGRPDGHTKDFFIVHSVGNNTQTAEQVRDNYFALSSVRVESTFIVGWGPDDPTRQIMDSTDRADANGAANRRGVSVEVVGDGESPYNAWQRNELIRVGVWTAGTHPTIPRMIAVSAVSGGFAWHVQFGAPGPWTSVAKTCPGAPRIIQLRDVIYPVIFDKFRSSVDMFSQSDSDRLDRVEGKLNDVLERIGSQPPGNLFDRTHRTLGQLDEIHAVWKSLAEKPGVSLTDVVAELTPDMREVVREAVVEAVAQVLATKQD